MVNLLVYFKFDEQYKVIPYDYLAPASGGVGKLKPGDEVEAKSFQNGAVERCQIVFIGKFVIFVCFPRSLF